MPATGTILAGTFSHLANVIQSGGEDGMWSFDRYQRWKDQQQEWVRPDGSGTWGAGPELHPPHVRTNRRPALPPLAEIEIASDATSRPPMISWWPTSSRRWPMCSCWWW